MQMNLQNKCSIKTMSLVPIRRQNESEMEVWRQTAPQTENAWMLNWFLFDRPRHTHTTVLRLFGFCPRQPGWASTRRNIHPLTLIVVINHPYLLSPSTMIHGILSVQSSCFTVFFHNLSPSFLWSTSWPGTLHFILHTFLHTIIIFFSQHMPIPLQPVLL